MDETEDRAWDGSASNYTDEQYARAWVLDRGPDAGPPKQRYSLPVRDPSGALNCAGVAAARGRLGQVTGATPEQIAAARSKLETLAQQCDNQGQRSRPQAGEVEERTAEALEVDGRRIRGVVPFNTVSRDMGGWKEQISPSAFRDTHYSELRAVIDHKGVPLGRYPKTLDIEERADGLHWSLDPPKSRQDVVEAIQRGDMHAGSWRMVVAKDSWQGETRTVESISRLLDVTITGAELPAYPAAAVEFRTTNPGEAQEVVMGNEPDNQQEQKTEERTTSGGIEAESVEVVSVMRDSFEEITIASREVNPGEVRSLTNAVSLSNPEYSTQFFDALRPQSAFLRSGVRTLTTQSLSVVYPVLTTEPTIGWVAEGGTISASDPALGSGTATPHRLSTRIEYSNELAEDSAPAVEQVLRQSLVARAAVMVDIAAYEGSGASPMPRGMGNISGITTINASAANTNINWAGSAIAALEAAYAPRPYVYAGGTSLAKDLRTLKAGTAYDPFMFPPGTEALPTLYGAAGFLAPAISSGTLYAYSPSSCFIVNRTAQFDVEINRARLFDSDRSEMRLRARLDFLYPYPSAIARGTGVP